MDEKYFYKCIDCGQEYSPSNVRYTCPRCESTNDSQNPPKGILKTVYDFHTNGKIGIDKLVESSFIDLLPIKSAESLSPLRIGQTPLLENSKIEGAKLPYSVFIKNDTVNPTFSFKDRASDIVSAYAKENGIDTIIAASTGNAGSSLAGICASQGQKAIIMVPESAPVAKLTQIIMYGATIIPVKGTYDDAFDLSIEATKQFGIYNRNTAFNPLTIEGKKTVSFELFEQMDHSAPDRIFVPVGDGCIISGVYKGYEDLLELGLIKKMPIIVAVQAKGSSNLINNLNTKSFTFEPSKTVADSISVDIPRNFNMTRWFIDKYNGENLTVEDDEILQASKILAQNTGVFAEPAAAAAYAGLLKHHNSNKIEKGTKNIVLITGSGLKDIQAVQSIATLPEAIEPQIENLKNILS